MPRTNQATLALTVALVILALCAVVNVWQTNSTESQVIALKKEVQEVTRQIGEVEEKLRSGVAVAGGGAGGAQAAGATDLYAASLDDPSNILQAPVEGFYPAEGEPGGTLRMAVISDYKGFNWLTENSVNVKDLEYIVNNFVARRDLKEPDRWIPQTAHKIEVSDDQKTIIIHFRKGVMWHTPAHPRINEDKFSWMREPRELTAEDYKFVFDMALNPQVEAGAKKGYLDNLDSVEVVDRYTLKITWKEKTYQALHSSLYLLSPMPKWLYTKNEDGSDIQEATLGLKFNNHWASQYAVGTGPYKFLEYKKGDGIYLKRNEDYFEGAPAIENLQIKIITDREQQLLQLKAGKIDVVERLTASQYKQEVLDGKDTPFTRGELEYGVFDRFAYYFLAWNMDKPMFADKRVRKALTHALNRQSIIDNVFHGLGQIQTGPFFYQHVGNDPNVTPYPFDLDAAKALLDEAGWSDSDGDGIRDKIVKGERVPFKFNMMTNAGSAAILSALSVYKEDLRKIGISMDFSPLDWPTMQKKMNEKKFDAFTGGWGMTWDIDPHQLWHSTQADIPKGSNRVGFRNKEADRIIEDLRSTFDEEKRVELMRAFHRLLHEEQPYTFFYGSKSFSSWQPHVKNFQVQKIFPQYYPIPWWIDQGMMKEQTE